MFLVLLFPLLLGFVCDFLLFLATSLFLLGFSLREGKVDMKPWKKGKSDPILKGPCIATIVSQLCYKNLQKQLGSQLNSKGHLFLSQIVFFFTVELIWLACPIYDKSLLPFPFHSRFCRVCSVSQSFSSNSGAR